MPHHIMEYLRFPEQLPMLGTAGTLPLDRTIRLFYKDVGQTHRRRGVVLFLIITSHR